MYRRRGRYFVGPLNATNWLRVIGSGPYCALPSSASALDLGAAVVSALEASSFEAIDGEEVTRLAEERLLELARAAGVSSWKTFERGARYVDVDLATAAEILVTPNHRRRGYWEPTPERYWRHLRQPSDAELGDAVLAALEIATA